MFSICAEWKRPSVIIRIVPISIETFCPEAEQGKEAASFMGAVPLRFPAGTREPVSVYCMNHTVEGGNMPDNGKEQYTYRIGKITFIVTPVYKDKKPGETIRDILLKLMRADIERA